MCVEYLFSRTLQNQIHVKQNKWVLKQAPWGYEDII